MEQRKEENQVLAYIHTPLFTYWKGTHVFHGKEIYGIYNL
jgi:hypothetical protein